MPRGKLQPPAKSRTGKNRVAKPRIVTRRVAREREEEDRRRRQNNSNSATSNAMNGGNGNNNADTSVVVLERNAEAEALVRNGQGNNLDPDFLLALSLDDSGSSDTTIDLTNEQYNRRGNSTVQRARVPDSDSDSEHAARMHQWVTTARTRTRQLYERVQQRIASPDPIDIPEDDDDQDEDEANNEDDLENNNTASGGIPQNVANDDGIEVIYVGNGNNGQNLDNGEPAAKKMRPSNELKDTKTENTSFSSNVDDQPSTSKQSKLNLSCPICFDDFEKVKASAQRCVMVTTCGHLFCSKCIQDSYAKAEGHRCPTCRKKLPKKAYARQVFI